jgi:enoyl-CoA hydratase/carnithine racemase
MTLYTLQRFYTRFLSLLSLPVPVLAAINGAAVGAGACVSLACDERHACSTAKIGFNFVNLGLHPG